MFRLRLRHKPLQLHPSVGSGATDAQQSRLDLGTDQDVPDVASRPGVGDHYLAIYLDRQDGQPVGLGRRPPEEKVQAHRGRTI